MNGTRNARDSLEGRKKFVRERQLLIVYLLCARTMPTICCVHEITSAVKGISSIWLRLGRSDFIMTSAAIIAAYRRVSGIYVNHPFSLHTEVAQRAPLMRLKVIIICVY